MITNMMTRITTTIAKIMQTMSPTESGLLLSFNWLGFHCFSVAASIDISELDSLNETECVNK